jgi:hypothetical protein
LTLVCSEAIERKGKSNMIEILVLIAFTGHIGKVVEAKGYKSGKYKAYAVGLWFGGELIGAILGSFFLSSAGDSTRCGAYIFALIGAAIGAFIANSIAGNLEPMPGYPLSAAPLTPAAAPAAMPATAPAAQPEPAPEEPPAG